MLQIIKQKSALLDRGAFRTNRYGKFFCGKVVINSDTKYHYCSPIMTSWMQSLQSQDYMGYTSDLKKIPTNTLWRPYI